MAAHPKKAGDTRTTDSEIKNPGRPSELTTIKMNQVEMLAKAGWTDAQMSKFFGVTEKTWNNWKKASPEFFQSLKAWKAEADHLVERSLFERATGYSHDDVHVSSHQGEVTLTPIRKHYPPDTTAAIFWLKNRKPAEWRDKKAVDDSSDTLKSLLRQIDGKTACI